MKITKTFQVTGFGALDGAIVAPAALGQCVM